MQLKEECEVLSTKWIFQDCRIFILLSQLHNQDPQQYCQLRADPRAVAAASSSHGKDTSQTATMSHKHLSQITEGV